MEADTLDVVEEGDEEEDVLETEETKTDAEAERDLEEAEATAAAAVAAAQAQAQGRGEAETPAVTAQAEAEVALQLAAVEQDAVAQAEVEAEQAASAAEVVRAEAQEQEAAEAALAELELQAIAELEAQPSDSALAEAQQAAGIPTDTAGDSNAVVDTGIPEGRPQKRLSALVLPPHVGPAADLSFYRPPSAASLAPTSWLHNLRPLSELQAQVASASVGAYQRPSTKVLTAPSKHKELRSADGINADEHDPGADARWADLHMERCFPRCRYVGCAIFCRCNYGLD